MLRLEGVSKTYAGGVRALQSVSLEVPPGVFGLLGPNQPDRWAHAWLDPERVGPFDVRPHLYGLGVLAFPTLAILGCFFFALATRVRRVMAVTVRLPVASHGP